MPLKMGVAESGPCPQNPNRSHKRKSRERNSLTTLDLRWLFFLTQIIYNIYYFTDEINI